VQRNSRRRTILRLFATLLKSGPEINVIFMGGADSFARLCENFIFRKYASIETIANDRKNARIRGFHTVWRRVRLQCRMGRIIVRGSDAAEGDATPFWWAMGFCRSTYMNFFWYLLNAVPKGGLYRCHTAW
jgi:hypothetical protein